MMIFKSLKFIEKVRVKKETSVYTLLVDMRFTGVYKNVPVGKSGVWYIFLWKMYHNDNVSYWYYFLFTI